MNVHFLRVSRTQIQQQIAQNLMEAGVLTQGEVEHHISELAKLDAKDLLATLLESHQLKEEKQEQPAGYTSPFHYIDPWTINSMN